MSSLSFSDLCEVAGRCGLDAVAVSSADELREDREALREWQSAGNAGEMGYMEREPELLSNPLRLLPEAQSIVLFTVRYESTPHPECPVGYGRVARYAWGKDYHLVLKERLRTCLEELRRIGKAPTRYRVFSDAVPLLERALARRAGLGFIGKNTLLIRPGEGSHFFIAEIVWDLQITGVPAPQQSRGGCGACTRCARECPTGALVQPFRLDARKCISYLTIEKRTPLTAWERQAVGEWAFGCDICQDVCPFNHRAIKGAWSAGLPQFAQSEGVGPLLDLRAVFEIADDAEYARRFEGTPLLRTGRTGLIRNGICVAVNTEARMLASDIERLLQHDSSPVVRQHAAWGALALAENSTIADRVRSVALRDPDAEVRNEVDDTGSRPSTGSGE